MSRRPTPSTLSPVSTQCFMNYCNSQFQKYIYLKRSTSTMYMSYVFGQITWCSRRFRTLRAFERFVYHMRSFVYFQKIHCTPLVWTLVTLERKYIFMDAPANKKKIITNEATLMHWMNNWNSTFDLKIRIRSFQMHNGDKIVGRCWLSSVRTVLVMGLFRFLYKLQTSKYDFKNRFRSISS